MQSPSLEMFNLKPERLCFDFLRKMSCQLEEITKDFHEILFDLFSWKSFLNWIAVLQVIIKKDVFTNQNILWDDKSKDFITL